MKRAFSALTIAALLGGCALNPRPFTRGEKWALATAVGCVAADVGTTLYAREVAGLGEANPLMRNYGVALSAQALLIGLAWVVGEVNDQRSVAWWSVAVPKCGLAVWNGAQIGRAK